jgi:hypothetical protein
MTRVRFVYHPAPGPTKEGVVSSPDPIDLGEDLDFVITWVRHRLALNRLPASPWVTNEPITHLDAETRTPERPNIVASSDRDDDLGEVESSEEPDWTI